MAVTKLALSRFLLIFGAVLVTYKFLISQSHPQYAKTVSDNTSINAYPIITSSTCRNKQQILSILPIVISSNNYKSWNSDVNLCNHTFPKLSSSLFLNTFSNKNMIFFGDSTMYRFYIFIVWCLDHYIHKNYSKACEFEASLFNDNDQEWNQYISTLVDSFLNSSINDDEIPITNLHHLQSDSSYSISYKYHDTFINTKLYLFENQMERNIEQLFNLYHSWIDLKPDIIFYNPFGLHLLHLFPLRPFQYNSIGIIDKYQENLLEIYKISKQINATMIYRGIGPLCYAKDTLRYYLIRKKYEEYYNDNNVESDKRIIGCINDMKQREIYQFDNHSINSMEFCTNWTFMNEGVLHQNALIERFVINLQETGDRNVFYYDRYKIFHNNVEICKDEAKDSVHWQPTYGADAMYLTNFINFV